MDLADSWHFFLIFWFFSWSLARRNLNFGGFGLRRAAAEAAWKRAAPRPEPLRGGGQNPQSLSFVLRAITKQNQNTQKKVPTTQPNPQYSAKNNVSIHMIEAFMPKPCPEESLKYTILYLPLFNSLIFQTKLQSAMLLLLFSIQFFSLFTSVILDHKFATLEFFAKNTTCNRHQFQKFQKNTQIYHGISL